MKKRNIGKILNEKKNMKKKKNLQTISTEKENTEK